MFDRVSYYKLSFGALALDVVPASKVSEYYLSLLDLCGFSLIPASGQEYQAFHYFQKFSHDEVFAS